jgi:uracil-DNA glycosylase
MKVLGSLLELKELLDKRWSFLLESTSNLLDRLEAEIDFENAVPSKGLILRAFNCDPKDVSVVIFGQDPYPDSRHATGLAFSVEPNIKKLPASLRNIFQEIQNDVGGEPENGDLTFLSKQGVMLLNRGLTFDLKTKKVHPLWYEFTDLVAKELAQMGTIGVFWGNKAHELAHHFPNDKKILGVHPSPLSAYRGFFGSQPFSRINEMLRSENKKIINWTKQ